ncbi:MAG: hypothetical protein AW12_02552 [Candidatus Accumulibacter sp. BA-94]|jgi:hypothetical protein|uniref:hypothetical protein n=1 Tax=Accumulibacter sp. TaxID=2053492 RepID=UPI000453A1F0|nr:hypothetical protein [Accumulibacter sp.]EXI83727.1 MAG: hypothetical protein AW12_02552 [Candidatus Accumulibacter sp. BA-94]MBL8390693.1 hypothetical protein [Accumulibacter sp.]HRD87134.1 hypothetical protein [Accumulibacter sp.]
MTSNITVITTANRARRFVPANESSLEAIVDSLRGSGQLFRGKPLIIGSGVQTEVFAAAAIACIEIETARDLEEYLPSQHSLSLTALTPEQRAEPFVGGLNGDHFSVRIEFFFTGGHVLYMVAAGARKPALAERLMHLTGLFERPALHYRLAQGGGVGLMNPRAMTRFLITPGVPDLPSDAWLAEAL